MKTGNFKTFMIEKSHHQSLFFGITMAHAHACLPLCVDDAVDDGVFQGQGAVVGKEDSAW